MIYFCEAVAEGVPCVPEHGIRAFMKSRFRFDQDLEPVLPKL